MTKRKPLSLRASSINQMLVFVRYQLILIIMNDCHNLMSFTQTCVRTHAQTRLFQSRWPCQPLNWRNNRGRDREGGRFSTLTMFHCCAFCLYAWLMRMKLIYISTTDTMESGNEQTEWSFVIEERNA